MMRHSLGTLSESEALHASEVRGLVQLLRLFQGIIAGLLIAQSCMDRSTPPGSFQRHNLALLYFCETTYLSDSVD